MDRLTGLVVKMVERCNLNCTYCYMYNHVDQTYLDRPNFMTRAVFDQLVSRIKEHLDESPESRLRIVFHGGEPMLMAPREFRARLEFAREQLGSDVMFVIQTNATLVTDEWVGVLKDLDVRVGASVDGIADVHDRLRIFHDGKGSYNKVVDGIRRLLAGGIRTMALCVVAPGTDGLAAYRQIRRIGVTSIDFIFPEESHDYHRWPPTATPIADYLIPAFDEWFLADDPSVRVRLFEAIIRVIRGGTSTVETIGHGPYRYLVIDTDGSIHGNDLLKVCDAGLSEARLNIRDNRFSDLRDGAPLAYQLFTEGLPIAAACATCPEVSVCGGGAGPMRYSRERGFDNPNVWCADLLKLITHIRRSLGETSIPQADGVTTPPSRSAQPQHTEISC